MDKSFTASLISHRSEQWILICFEQDAAWNKRMKQVPGSKWSRTHKGWLIPNTPANRKKCKVSISETLSINAASKEQPQKINDSPIAISAEQKLSKENLTAMQKFTEQLKLKAYSPSTIRTYQNEFMQLLKLLKKKPASGLMPDDLKRYMVYAMEKEGINENTAHSRLNALKFYYEQVLYKNKFFFEIPRPKKPLLLPKVFSQDDIAAIIRASGNIKHKAMLMLAYAAGLRVSEVVSVKVQDIDSKRMCVLISQAKGKKDRMVRLSPVLLVMLREYWKKEKPVKNGYLFPGQNKGEAYSSRSLQLVLASAKQKAGILKPGSIHTLRHSFATHLLDKGTDVTMIQKLLGHNDIKTTLRYLHVTNRDILQVISPLDDLKL